jgi:AcrR family transcriptional regulator
MASTRARRAPPAAARDEPVRARLDVDERRRQLLALGLEHFGDRAYDEVSIDELADAAGISKGLLYHYFPTKRDFYVATVSEAARELLERTATPPGGDPLERLRTGLDAYLDYVSTHGRPYAALLRGGIGTDAEVARVVDAARETVCARLVEGIRFEARRPILRVALRGWIGFVEAATLDWLAAPRGVSRASLREMLARVLMTVAEVAAAP